MPDDDESLTPSASLRQSQRLGRWAQVVLVPVAAIGAVLSFRSLYEAAVPTFGQYLAAGFPLLVDLLILGASLQYVSGAKIGRAMAGWRLTAHAGVAGTLVLNALAAPQPDQIPWHITAPAVWAVLVELTAKQVMGEWKATHTARADTISAPLWITAPIESVRTRLLMFRTGITNAHQARISVGVHAAAREALHLALPGRKTNPRRSARRVRRVINRQLRAGSLHPSAILQPLGWTAEGVTLRDSRPEAILHGVLHGVLAPAAQPTQPSEPPQTDSPAADQVTSMAPPVPVQTQRVVDLAATPAVAPVEHTPNPPVGQSTVGQSHDQVAATHGLLDSPAKPENPAENAQPDENTARSAAEPAAGSSSDDTSGRTDDPQQRLAHATQIVQRKPSVTGPELQAQLAQGGWQVSPRTATRILAEVRRKEANDHRLRVVRT